MRKTHIGNDVVRCRADAVDDDLLLTDDEASLTFDAAVLLLADLTLPYTTPAPFSSIIILLHGMMLSLLGQITVTIGRIPMPSANYM